ncbi:hypothetical protein [Streptomyces sp. NPDC054786]
MITVVGEALVDLVQAAGAPSPRTGHPGGSPANVAVSLAGLEAPGTLITQLGKPEDASRMLDAATRVAAFTCTRPGADPPTLRELRAFRPQGQLATP